METKKWTRLGWLLLALLVLTGRLVQAQHEEPVDRGTDIWYRKKASVQPHPGKTQPPKPGSNAGTPPPVARPVGTGFGVTLFKKTANGVAVRVNQGRVFQSEENVRFVFEPNLDGYLYLFHTDNGRNPKLIFPSWRLKNGINQVHAFVPYEVPSSREENPLRQWFRIYGAPTTEKFYVIVSREPLPNVPIGQDLLAYCEQNQGGCPWKPTGTEWQFILSQAQNKLNVTKSREFGQEQTEAEREAAAREVDLTEDAPKPATTYLNPATNQGIVVAVIDLVHQ